MIIGVDCDGVLTDMSAYIHKYGVKYFKREPVNVKAPSAAEMFGCTKKEEFRFGLRYFFTYCKKWPPRKNSVEIINRLKGEGHQLYEITARKFVTQNNPLGRYSGYLFRRWIKKHGFNFDDIYFCSEDNAPEDKLNGCKKYAADIMIDDSPEIAVKLADNGITVLLFDTGYNKNVNYKNIIRVYDWNDVYEKIQNLKL